MSAIAIGIPESGRSAHHQFATFRYGRGAGCSPKRTGSFRAAKRTDWKRPNLAIAQTFARSQKET
jgi:hypothetical protein